MSEIEKHGYWKPEKIGDTLFAQVMGETNRSVELSIEEITEKEATGPQKTCLVNQVIGIQYLGEVSGKRQFKVVLIDDDD